MKFRRPAVLLVLAPFFPRKKVLLRQSNINSQERQPPMQYSWRLRWLRTATRPHSLHVVVMTSSSSSSGAHVAMAKKGPQVVRASRLFSFKTHHRVPSCEHYSSYNDGKGVERTLAIEQEAVRVTGISVGYTLLM